MSKETTSSALALAAEPEQIAALDTVLGECNLQVLSASAQFEQTFKMAAGIRQISEMITDAMMVDIMALQNIAVGFKTDKPQGYDVATVKRCLIEALIHGIHATGNEFNIISGGMYMTKQGVARLVREFKGLTDLCLSPAVPLIDNDSAIVHYEATWKLDGAAVSLVRDIPVRVNKMMGADAILGKATRKMLAAIYGQLTGSEHAVPEGDVGDVIDVASSAVSGGASDNRSNLTDVVEGLEEKPAEEFSVEETALVEYRERMGSVDGIINTQKIASDARQDVRLSRESITKITKACDGKIEKIRVSRGS